MLLVRQVQDSIPRRLLLRRGPLRGRRLPRCRLLPLHDLPEIQRSPDGGVGASTPAARFRLAQGNPVGFASTADWVRFFCCVCGAPVYQRAAVPSPDGSDRVCILIPSLDDPTEVQPTVHIWCSSRLPYFDTKDEHPGFPDGRITHPDTRESWRTA
jgi:hypothetical protein